MEENVVQKRRFCDKGGKGVLYILTFLNKSVLGYFLIFLEKFSLNMTSFYSIFLCMLTFCLYNFFICRCISSFFIKNFISPIYQCVALYYFCGPKRGQPCRARGFSILPGLYLPPSLSLSLRPSVLFGSLLLAGVEMAGIGWNRLKYGLELAGMG